MKLVEAEELLRVKKLSGPCQEPWIILTDEGVTLEWLPMGAAVGAISWWNALCTVFPKIGYSALYQGDGRPHRIRIPKLSCEHLWDQEMFVYQKELRDHVAMALRGLGGSPFYRRKGENFFQSVKSEPYPEDFLGGFGAFRGKPEPAVGWHTIGRTTELYRDIQWLKRGFYGLLERFIKEQHDGEGQVVRIRSAVSPQTDKGPGRKKRVA